MNAYMNGAPCIWLICFCKSIRRNINTSDSVSVEKHVCAVVYNLCSYNKNTALKSRFPDFREKRQVHNLNFYKKKKKTTLISV